MVNGVEFSDPKFHPVWAKAEELGVPLFIHPQGVAELNKRLSGNGWLGNTIGNPLETTIALSHLIFEGTLDKFPGLKVIAAHGGGYLPSYADRSDHACLVGPRGCNPDIKLKKKPTEYLKQLYFDSLIFTPEAIRHLVAQVGASQVVLGSDYPYPWELQPVDHIFASTSLSDDEKADDPRQHRGQAPEDPDVEAADRDESSLLFTAPPRLTGELPLIIGGGGCARSNDYDASPADELHSVPEREPLASPSSLFAGYRATPWRSSR